jgi:aldose 1-epimerase
VRFSLNRSALKIEYTAESDKDTVFNPTNHAYFNLGDVSGTRLQIFADYYTPVDSCKIPTGELASVSGTDYDFRQVREISRHFDHNFVLRGSGRRLAAAACGEVCSLRVYTTMPAIQLYTVEDGFCLESQFFPDSPNFPHFPSCVLKKGELFISSTEYELLENA